MTINQLVMWLVAAAFSVLGTQSVRLYLKTRIVPALLFALHFYILSLVSLIAILGKADVTVSGKTIPYSTVYSLLLACLIVVAALFFVYMLSRSRLITCGILVAALISVVVWLTVRIGAIQPVHWFYAATPSSITSVGMYVATVVPVCLAIAAAFGTFKQMLEDGMHLLASVRLILIGITQSYVAAILLTELVFKRAVFSIPPFVYSLCAVSVVLALLSLLTPINRKQKVEHPVY